MRLAEVEAEAEVVAPFVPTDTKSGAVLASGEGPPEAPDPRPARHGLALTPSAQRLNPGPGGNQALGTTAGTKVGSGGG